MKPSSAQSISPTGTTHLLPPENVSTGILYPRCSQIWIVHYVGIIEDGKKSNASSNRNKYFVILGKQVIQGWKEGQVQKNVSRNRLSDISYDSATDLLDTANATLRIHSYKNIIYTFHIWLLSNEIYFVFPIKTSLFNTLSKPFPL